MKRLLVVMTLALSLILTPELDARRRAVGAGCGGIVGCCASDNSCSKKSCSKKNKSKGSKKQRKNKQCSKKNKSSCNTCCA